MWLFEVNDSVRAGFRLVLRSGEAGVPMGYDESIKGAAWLPLGTSIERALQHPDDQQENFLLKWAKLDDKTAGLMLVAQTEEEAKAERLALVLVDGCLDPELGATNIAEAFNKPMPELITYARGNGQLRNLYVFRPGDGLFISWSAKALDADRPRRFVISWEENAETKQMELKELAVGRPRRNSRPPKRVREEKKRRQDHPIQLELRP